MTSPSKRNGSAKKNAHYVLGIDVGTTSVKVCLVNTDSKEVSHKFVKDTLARTAADVPGADLQDMGKIFSALHGCIARIPHEQLRRVVRIAICGQMHGIMFWTQGQGLEKNHDEPQQTHRQQLEVLKPSPVYTWQDARCDGTFLADLPSPNSHLRLSTGYGCATIFWLLRNKQEYLQQFDRCGSPMDFIVCLLTGTGVVKTSPQVAAAWGYFDTVTSEWNKDLLLKHQFPVSLLPTVIDASCDAGCLDESWFDIPAGTPVGSALGDLQCSVRSTFSNPKTDAVLNVSTSAQMAFVKQSGFVPTAETDTIEYFPYFDGNYVAVAASLNGGNCLAAFVKMLQEWAVDLGLSIPQSKIWEKTIKLGENVPEEADLMKINATMFGERHRPDLKATLENVTPANIGLGHVTKAICRGVAENLASMMPPEMLIDAGLTRIMASGACLSRNPVLKLQMQEVYKLPVEFASEGSACTGAALAAIDAHRKRKKIH